MKNSRQTGFISFFVFLGTFAGVYFLGQTDLSSSWRWLLTIAAAAVSALIGAVLARVTDPDKSVK